MSPGAHRRTVEDALEDVGAATAWADGVLAAAECPEAIGNDIQICIEEALANLIRHARPKQDGKAIALEISADDACAEVAIFDACEPFDSTIAQLPPAPTVDDLRVGGQGLRLIQDLATGLRYVSAPTGNVLTMRFSTAAPLEKEIISIRRIPVFADLPQRELETLLASSRLREYQAGAKIVHQGDASRFAYVLLSGAVSVINESAHGAAPVAQIAAPALFGEIGALADLRRTASIVAARDVRVLRIERAALLSVCRHAPDILVSVIGQLGQQIHNVNSALGLYASGFEALERGDLSDALDAALGAPGPELQNFGAAFGRLAQRISAERRSRNEMASAALIQREMLPRDMNFPGLAGRCEISADIKPARLVGGDFFDAVMLDGDRLVLAIGDVCGKGAPAALFMSVTVTMLRVAAQAGDPLEQMIERVNALLYANNSSGMFATLFYGVLDLETRQLDYVNCGHNPPFHRARSGAWSQLQSGGPPIAILPNRTWPMHRVELAPGDALFLFSDGVSEAQNADSAEYSEARLEALLNSTRAMDANALVQAVMSDVDVFADGAEQFDDITCLAAVLA